MDATLNISIRTLNRRKCRELVFRLVPLDEQIRNNLKMLSPSRMQLLVAEDNAEWRNIIAHILEPECDLAAFVERGDQILGAAERFRPGLITLDVRMPGESGLNVLPRLRAMLPHAIIIVVSSTAAPIYKEEAFARGADAYIEKAKVSSELIETIEAILKRGEAGSNSQTL